MPTVERGVADGGIVGHFPSWLCKAGVAASRGEKMADIPKDKQIDQYHHPARVLGNYQVVGAWQVLKTQMWTWLGTS